MKVIAWIFGVLFGAWLLLLLIGFLLPGHYRVERTTLVDAPPDRVFSHIGDLKAWRGWAVWFARDPDMKVEYSPATSEIGAWCRWTSKSQGDGKMTISDVRPGREFDYRMEFTDVGMVSRGSMVLAPDQRGGTSVTMAMEGDLGRSPTYRWFGFFMNRMVGPDFERGLENLKKVSEAAGK